MNRVHATTQYLTPIRNHEQVFGVHYYAFMTSSKCSMSLGVGN